MTMFIGQMLGCLLVAAGIGSVVGWWLRHLSVGPLAQQLTDLTTTLRHKDQALEKLQEELQVNVSAMQILEEKMIASESLQQSTRQELSLRHERNHVLQEELTARKQRLAALESRQAILLTHASANEAVITAQAEEALQSKAALDAAHQALCLKKQELLPSQERLADLEHRLADTDRLRTRIQELEPAQGRVHWLEVQLSERETQHRTVLHDIERQLAERDRRIGELEQLHQPDRAPSQNTGRDIDELQVERLAHEQRLKVKDEHIAALQQRIGSVESVQRALTSRANIVDEKEEEISRLQMRLIEVRAALQIRTDGGGAPRPIQPAGDQLTLQIAQPAPSTRPQKDDLTEIRGIGPAFERALNNMGIMTFRKIAQWDATNLKQIADQLETLPERITRDQWIARARKLHEQKYGKGL